MLYQVLRLLVRLLHNNTRNNMRIIDDERERRDEEEERRMKVSLEKMLRIFDQVC